MDRSGVSNHLLALMSSIHLLCFELYRVESASYATLLSLLLGTNIEVSPLLRFHWYQQVLYALEDAAFCSQPEEAFGHFVGIAPDTRHAMTYKVLSTDTNKVLLRFNVCPADDPVALPSSDLPTLFMRRPSSNLRETLMNRQTTQHITQKIGRLSKTLLPSMLAALSQCMKVRMDNGIERKLLKQLRITIHYSIKTRLTSAVNNDQYKELMSYNDIITHLERQ